MIEITQDQVREFKEMFNDELELYSTFTHVEGDSYLSSYWTEIITEYSLGDNLILKLVTIKEEKDSEKINKYYILKKDK